MTMPRNERQIRSRARGFTLVEVMISSALLSVILGGAMVVVVGVNGASERVRRVGDAQEAARLALIGLSEEIRVAGAGASSGLIGVAPSGGNTRRIPVVYSGPDVTVTQPNGTTTMITNSIYVISTEPGFGIPGSDGTATLGVVTGTDGGAPIQVECAGSDGGQVNCSDDSRNGALIRTVGGSIMPLLVGDYANAVYMRPTNLGGISSGSQPLTFSELGSGAYSPDPKAPFGFSSGAAMSVARVTHWYLRQIPPASDNHYELVRSHPTLTTSALGAICADTDAPFVDEITPGGPGVPVGVVVGSGPLASMQIRYVMDANQTDDPQQYTVWNGANNTTGNQTNHLSICDGAQALHLREVRIQVVARAAVPDHATNATGHVSRYSTPGYDGATPSDTGTDAFPRRSFEARVVPRNLQGVLRL